MAMSYIICHVEKYKRAEITKIEQHNKRLKKESRTNKDIDWSRTKYNIEASRGKYIDCIDKRLNEIPPPVRKRGPKNNYMAEILVSASPEFFANAPINENFRKTYAMDFFNDAKEFIFKKYGKENVLGISIHLDEKTPHMHVDIVPILENKLNPKALFSPTTLTTLQNEIWKEVGQKYGLKRGIPRDKEHRKKHLSVNEYKAKKDAERAQELLNAEQARIDSQWDEILAQDLTDDEINKLYEISLQMVAERRARQEEKMAADFAPK